MCALDKRLKEIYKMVTVIVSSRIIGDFYFLLYTLCILIIFIIFSIMSHFPFLIRKKCMQHISVFMDTLEFLRCFHIFGIEFYSYSVGSTLSRYYFIIPI